MTLPAGARLGPYVVIAPLGRGGMGEVYRARDLRLDREIAIKRLPPDRAADPDHRARLLQEARAASALDHPHIVTIHSVERHDDMDFIVMELVTGETVAEVLQRGPLPLPEALRVGAALADAIAHAHAAGVVHRDLKPANVMLTAEGVVKVLDFGVARLLRDRSAGPDAATETVASSSGSRVFGTAGYMAPEQATGDAGDERSDVFSFGALLYEMVTGRRAFAGASSAETIAAILRDEPPPAARLVPSLPPDLDRILRRCLRKDPARRFQSMADVRIEMLDVEEERAAAPLSAAGAYGGRGRLVAWTALALALLALSATAFRSAQRGTPPPPLLFQLTWAGRDGEGAFSPDGTQIAFASRAEKGNNRDIWLKLVGEGEARRLTTDPAVDRFPAWSPDGRQIAFVRSPRAEELAVARPDRRSSGEILLVSPLGGAERRLLEFQTESQLAWSPDGRWLAAARVRVPGETHEGAGAIHAIAVDDGETRLMTRPAPPAFDTFPAFSPDGRALAFSACESAELVAACDVHVLPLDAQLKPAGARRRLTTQRRWITGLTWTRDGRSVVYGTGRLWRVEASGDGAPERIELGGRGVYMPTIAPLLDRLAFVRNLWDPDIYRLQLGGAITPLIESAFVDAYPSYSPDGRRIAFESSRAGEANEIWLAEADGGNATRLTRGPHEFQGSPRWSPDGRSIAFDSRTEDGRWDIWVVGADGSYLRQLTRDPGDENLPSWSHDGRFVYFTSSRTGRAEVFRVPAGGGPIEQVTRDGGCTPFESPDGRTLYYMRSCANDALLARPAAGGPERTIAACVAQRSYAVSPGGVFHVDCRAPQARETALQVVLLWDAASGRDTPVGTVEAVWLGGLSSSPDGKSLLFGRSMQPSDLMMIENFR